MFSKKGDYNEIPKPGRPKIQEARNKKFFRRKIKENPNITCEQMRRELETENNVHTSTSTIRSCMHETDFSFKGAITSTPLSKKHKKKRLEWALNNLDQSFDDVIFTDETSFWLDYERSKKWVEGRTNPYRANPRHSEKLHAYGAITSIGLLPLYFFTTNLNSSKMIEIYSHHLIPIADAAFGNQRTWILLEDRDPKHRSRKCKKFKLKTGIHPDFNPMENVWAILKKRLAAYPHHNIRSYKNDIIMEYDNLKISP